jgi:redox-sensitive bicupin YhaK (pirin superfamily)
VDDCRAGLIHSEDAPPEFKQHGGALEILQLWVNLPARLKMTPSQYTGRESEEIPATPLPNRTGTLHLISGEFDGVKGPIQSRTGVFMSTVELRAGATVDLPTPIGRSVFLYVVEGRGRLGGKEFEQWQLLELNDDGEVVHLESTTSSFLIFGHAQAIGEPLAAKGPFVMNTDEEIQQAVRDYESGRIGDPT